MHALKLLDIVVGLKVWLPVSGRVNLAWCEDGSGTGIEVGVSVVVGEGGRNSMGVF